MLTFIRIEISISLVNIEIVAHQGARSLPPPPLASCVSFSLRLASDSPVFLASGTEEPRRFTSNAIRCTSDFIATNRQDSAFMRLDLHFGQMTIETARRRQCGTCDRSCIYGENSPVKSIMIAGLIAGTIGYDL